MKLRAAQAKQPRGGAKEIVHLPSNFNGKSYSTIHSYPVRGHLLALYVLLRSGRFAIVPSWYFLCGAD